MSSSNLVRIAYKKESSYGVVPAAVKASLVVQDITYEAVKGGQDGNDISIEYENTATAGSETVTVTGNAIVIGIESGVSTATQVKTAFDAEADATALATATISGTAGDAQVTAAETSLATGSGQANQVRFASEKYSGTPETVESQQIRTDRMSSGQVVTGLTVAGGHNFELSKETALEDFLESAMFNAWETHAPVNGSFELNLSTKKLIRATGSFIDEGVEVGDVIVLSNFANSANNVPVMATAVTDLEVTFAHPTGMATAASEAATYQIADKLSIGTTKKSLSIEKAFLDLTNKAIIYKGCLVSQMELNIAYGSLISGSFETMGNDYDTADAANEFAVTYGEYISDPATTNTLNGSVDMPFLVTNVTGSYVQDAFCLQSLNLTLNNNLTPQTCIGNSAPENYNPGTASIQVDLSSYLKDANWDLLAKKLSQEPFAIGFIVKNTDGWYGFYLPALQVSFEDPASGGQNQDISMAMAGTAKVGSGGVSALNIYRAPTV